MMLFYIGQKVIHPEYGAAIVRFIGEVRVGLEFPDGQHGLFKKDAFTSEPKKNERPSTEEATSLPWPQSTFVQGSEDDKHYLGAHWQPFVDDAEIILKKLPEYIASAQMKNAIGLLLKPERALPEEWIQGVTLAWPSSQEGIAITVRVTAERNEIANLYPFTQSGSQHLLKVKKVIQWEDGLTAQINVAFGYADLTFFDSNFVANRGWYEAGRSQEFLLTGFAYSAKPSEIFELPVTHCPDDVAWRNQLAEQDGDEPLQETESLSLKGMALLIPFCAGDLDEYGFRGEILQVKPFSDYIGQNGWRVRVQVVRDVPENLDLDIIITEKVWEGECPPQVGEDIEGILWLQGHLWSTQYMDTDEY
jgi:hypothetical protein